MSAPLPSHVTLQLAELRETLRRGSPTHKRCVGCNRFVLLPQDRSWCDACEARWEARLTLMPEVRR